MVYGCCILLLFETKSPSPCRNYHFELLMQNMTEPILRVNSEDMCVIMKYNTVLAE